MSIFAAIDQKINQAQQIIISSHASPDGDAIGSSLAMYSYLLEKNKKVQVIIPDKIPYFLEFLPDCDKICIYENQVETANEYLKNSDLFFCLDYNQLQRLGKKMEENVRAHFKGDFVMIDHHLDPEDFGQLYFGDPSRASTAELVYDLIAADEKTTITTQMATCIYTGILTDTGSFRFSATKTSTHQIIAHLLKNEIEHDKIYRQIYESNSESKMRLWGYATYKKLKIFPSYKTAIIDLNQKELQRFGVKEGYLEGLANHILTLKEAKLGILLSEKDGKIKISLRSEGQFAVNEMSARFLQGGGHRNAAGGVFFGTMQEALAYFENIIFPFYQNELADQ